MKGTVTKLFGKGCIVATDAPDPQHYECYLRGRLFEKPGVAFAVGDRVEFDPVEKFDHTRSSAEKARLTGVIHEVLPRRSSLTRPAKRKEKQPQLIAANLDQLVIVSAIKRPLYKTGLIDRYLIVAHRSDIEAALCMNKIDLGQPSDLERARAELRPYIELGFPVVWTCAKTGEGCDELAALLSDKRSVLVGHSGVGKSKLAGRIQPGVKLASSSVRRSGKGRHTTSASTLIPLDFGGELVDTPGVRELGVTDISREKLARHFIEFAPLLGSCKFKSCSHIPEPGCAVKEAVESGHIHRARHESYVNLYHELSSAGRR